jgi:hypothetical protein
MTKSGSSSPSPIKEQSPFQWLDVYWHENFSPRVSRPGAGV